MLLLSLCSGTLESTPGYHSYTLSFTPCTVVVPFPSLSSSGMSVPSVNGHKTEILIDIPDPPFPQRWYPRPLLCGLHSAWLETAACWHFFRLSISSKHCRKGRIHSSSTWFWHLTCPRYLHLCCASSESSRSPTFDRLVFTRRLFTGQQGGITIPWICIVQYASVNSVPPMWGRYETLHILFTDPPRTGLA